MINKIDAGDACSPTGREKKFIDGLGGWAKTPRNPRGTGLTRLQLLQRYYQTLDKRVEWDEIEEWEVRRYLKESIRRAGGRLIDS